MKLAYLILAHDRATQFQRLVSALHHDHVEFFVHIDKKSSILPFQQGLSQRNITFLSQRQNVRWGRFEIVLATLQLMQAALSSRADYYILLSGADYPIKPNKYIQDFFAHANGEFITFTPVTPDGWKEAATRFERRYFSFLPLPLVQRWKQYLPKRSFIDGWTPYAGSQWWCLSRGCITYILDYLQRYPHVIRYFRDTWFPMNCSFKASC